MKTDDVGHVPVLLMEAVDGLNVIPGKWYIDATFGRGGHTREILSRGGKVIAFDQDSDAIMYGQRHFVFELEKRSLVLIKRNFEFLEEEVRKLGFEVATDIYGVLADFGVSSNQLDEGERGFSFSAEAHLDMRMSQEQIVAAKDLVNGLGNKELQQLLIEFGGERHARVIAEAIVKQRKQAPIKTTKELADLIASVVRREGHLHPATKTFMALRMLVNDELGVIQRMLPQAFALLQPTGRLVTISFHEGEDRLVKHFMKEKASEGKAMLVTKKPITVSEEEIEQNSRSRSAKLRIAEKE
ncbi:16S rRNA (cytosine(1402)-N(4))-methyltransferase [Candidatus Cerribacteria bacterium 'Amazon FNV 2010 28 9']|uniref:Ribosomal RNA small subunit methyltransferase H n=1 Tax=Candidatus Cerribacteria bacterium 'Amazon FNV 2010 28 9' TaxID=2081795 RepID=A0A317JSG1_9BACT|nr:MAG: 16S rRNA (cytosine(1402)-N(4))-methyltransferase [Candidatus Cerribacteria bacterium 'Amazon FNV 2010 28 9']